MVSNTIIDPLGGNPHQPTVAFEIADRRFHPLTRHQLLLSAFSCGNSQLGVLLLSREPVSLTGPAGHLLQ